MRNASGQFAPLYFGSWDQMRQIIGNFVDAQGNPGATNDPVLRQAFIVLGNVSLALNLSSQAALDKLATVTAQAAADNRGRLLRKVA